MTTRDRAFAVAAVVFVVLTLAVGFWEAGTPARQREFQADERRINDLRNIAGEIHQLWISTSVPERKIPESLEKLAQRPGRPSIDFKDPILQQPYSYESLTPPAYRLCATFSHPAPRYLRFWTHPAGRHCFNLDASQAAPYE